MNTASRFLIALGLTLAAAGITLDAPRAHAQDVQITGPLAGAPAVRKMRIYRDGRFQLQPTFSATLLDEFARTMFVGVQAGYHFTDWLGVHAFFNYGVASLSTGLTDQVNEKGLTTDFNRLSLNDRKKFDKQIGKMQYLAGVQATFIPLRGKLAMFQALFVDTDFYIFGGAAFAGVEERADVKIAGLCSPASVSNPNGNPDACARSQTARATRMAIAPTFGLGLSMFFNDYLALTLEYRAFPFKWNNSGTDEGGQNKNRKADTSGEFPDGKIDASDRVFQFNQMFSLGLAFYLPTAAVITD